jgi:hypothetical protein
VTTSSGRAWRVLVFVLLVLAACSGEPDTGEPVEELPKTTSTVSAGDSGGIGGTDSDEADSEGAQVVSGLVGVEVEVSNAVAPFDHDSNVDNLLLGMAISRVRTAQIFECLSGEGFPTPELTVLPSRDDPFLMSNWAFPDTDRLSREGFPVLPGTPASPDDERERSQAELEASRQCSETVDREDVATSRAYELYGSVRNAWEEVLAEVEGLEEIGSLVDGFSLCLRSEGIPAESAGSELSYLSHVDSLKFEAGSDDVAFAEIGERYGKLYAECGRELFETRERLRGGERRDVFLREHEAAIRELNELLYGAGG